MKATVITIGDEILIGQIVDTNSAWIGQKFSELGVKLHEIISVGDDAAQIVDALNRAKTSSSFHSPVFSPLHFSAAVLSKARTQWD